MAQTNLMQYLEVDVFRFTAQHFGSLTCDLFATCLRDLNFFNSASLSYIVSLNRGAINHKNTEMMEAHLTVMGGCCFLLDGS